MLQIVPGGFVLNGQKTKKLIGRSTFKLANIVGYHYKGRGGGDKGWNSLNYARRYVERQQNIFGENVVLRVFLETAGWDQSSTKMFGREPHDLGFWERNRLRDGNRELGMHALGSKVLEWFFKTSEETGAVFELVIDATLKHDNIPKGEIDHVIRQVGIRAGGLANQYRKSLVIMNCRNEWNAHNHSGHSLSEVNMWAVRWDRDDYTPQGMKPIVCPGGGDTFTYDVGPDDGEFGMGLIHPHRQPNDRNWWELPDINSLRRKARGMPVGFNESMYLVKVPDFDRAITWYRNRGGWTHNFQNYERFATDAIDKLDYFIFHDEDGVGCDTTRTTNTSRLESTFGVGNDGPRPAPNPPPLPPPPGPSPPPGPEPPAQGDWFRVDINGERTLKLQANIGPNDYPWKVNGGSEESLKMPGDQSKGVLRASWSSDEFVGRTVERVYTFLGLERGDIAELNVLVFDGSIPIAMRDKHKGVMSDWDAWVSHPESKGHVIRGKLTVKVIGRCNGTQENPEHVRFRELSIVPHFGAYIVWKGGQKPNPNPPPAPAPAPGPGAEYMPRWDDIKGKRFGMRPHANSTYASALFAIRQQLWWDGYENPRRAILDSSRKWPYTRGSIPITKAMASDLMQKSVDLMKRLNHFIAFDSRVKHGGKPLSGRWLIGKVRKSNFTKWYKDLMDLWPLVEAANGIANPGKPI